MNAGQVMNAGQIMNDSTAVSPAAQRPAARLRPATAGEALGDVVLVHGTLDESGSFRRVMDYLPRWRLTTYDRRGWGRSAGLGPTDPDGHAHDLAAILTERGPSIVVGHSYGATVALTVAATHPHLVQAVIAYEAPLPWLPWWPSRAPWERSVLDEGRSPADAAEELLRSALGYDAWQRLPDRVREHRRSQGPVLMAEMRYLCEAGPSFDPETITCPVVTAAGAASPAHHHLSSRRLADLLPDGVFQELADAGHPAHVTHPEPFARLVEAATAATENVRTFA